MVRILIVDDHEMLRDAISMALRRLGPDFQLFGVSNGVELLAWLVAHGQPDLVLLDVELPGDDGISVLKQLKRRYIGIKVAMLSGRDDPSTIQEALDAGAIGFIAKASSTDALLVKIRELLRGMRVVSSSQLGWPARGSDTPPGGMTLAITKTQQAVMEYIIAGLKNREIAVKLNIAEGTVKAHTNAIFKALNVDSRAQLQAWARKHGM